MTKVATKKRNRKSRRKESNCAVSNAPAPLPCPPFPEAPPIKIGLYDPVTGKLDSVNEIPNPANAYCRGWATIRFRETDLIARPLTAYEASLSAHTVNEADDAEESDSLPPTLSEELEAAYASIKEAIEAAQFIGSKLLDNCACILTAAEEIDREVEGPPDGDENARYAVVQVSPFEPVKRMSYREEAEAFAKQWAKRHGRTIIVRERYELPSTIDLLIMAKRAEKGGAL